MLLALRKALTTGMFVAAVAWPTAVCNAGGGPKNVLLVINDNSTISQSIGTYYQQKRGIPVRNLCHIRCNTSEITSKDDYFNNIAAPIRNFIESSGIHDRIDYIVLTKGIPLTARWTKFPDTYTFSVTSMLTCVGEPSITDAIINPYGPTSNPPASKQSFSHSLDFGGKHFYAVTRLDARTEADIYRMIDDSINAVPSSGLFLLDGASVPPYDYTAANNRLRTANTMLAERGYITYYDSVTFDSRLNEFAGNQQGVMGYFSWGSNESSFTHDLYVSNKFRPGSIADTFVSTSGRTFTSPWTAGTQSLIVDLVEQGASAVNGYVDEPAIGCATYPNVLFDRYVSGYNIAESFLAATPYLYWRSVVSGDPLMAPFATPPSVTMTAPDPSKIAHGIVPIRVSASDASGIKKVEIYVDDSLVATLQTAPYEYAWDTRAYADGEHVVEAIAYEDSDVYTQGMAKITVHVINTTLDIAKLSDLSGLQDGRLVRVTAKPIIAGTDAFTDCIYICETDRSCGIKVIGVENAPTGASITLTGEVARTDGETAIIAESSTLGPPSSVPEPFAVVNLNIGNRGARKDAISADLYPGLCNSGLLVRTWGFVTKVTGDGFYISDRSLPGASDGIRISLGNLRREIQPPLLGSYVVITGVSAFYNCDGRVAPTIRPRQQSDILSDIPIDVFMPPPGTVRQGWNLASLPSIAIAPMPEQVLGGIPISNNLFVWDVFRNSFLGYDDYSQGSFPSLVPGLAFWLLAEKDYTIMFEGLVQMLDTDFWVSLPQPTFTLIGHPFSHATNINNCLVSDGRQVIPIETAADYGWIGPSLYFWDNLHNCVGAVDIGFGNISKLEPWRGYWIRSYLPNLALIVPDEPN